MPRRADARSLLAWIKRRPVALFLVTTFLVTFGLGIPALILAGSFVSPRLPDPLGLYLARTIVVLGPTCGALAAVAAADGRAAMKVFLGRNLRVERQQLVIIAILPILTLGVSVAAYVAAGASPAALAAAIGGAWPLLAVHFALQILVIGVGEEIGWRGWLLPELASRYGIAMATLATGLVWYAWHLPILLQGIGSALSFAVGIGGLALLFTLLWLQAGKRASLPAIAHGCVNAPLFFFPATIPAADHQTAWQFVVGIYATIALLMLAGLRFLGRRFTLSQSAAGAA